MRSLKILLLSSAFNGLTQRAWLDLRWFQYNLFARLRLRG